MTLAELNRYLRNPGLLNEQTLAQVEDLIKEFPAFDLGWAIWLKNLKNVGVNEPTKYLPEVAIRVADRKWLKNFLEAPVSHPEGGGSDSEYLLIADYVIGEESGSVMPGPEGTKTDNKMSLIESFLAGGGTWEKKEISATPETIDLSEKAISESDDIITETFANILWHQGKHEKALDTFKKLSLKYPEKSIYFAARIEELKTSLKIN